MHASNVRIIEHKELSGSGKVHLDTVMALKNWNKDNYIAEFYTDGTMAAYMEGKAEEKRKHEHLDYITSDGTAWRLKLKGDTFVHAPNGDFGKAHEDANIAYITWNGMPFISHFAKQGA